MTCGCSESFDDYANQSGGFLRPKSKIVLVKKVPRSPMVKSKTKCDRMKVVDAMMRHTSDKSIPSHIQKMLDDMPRFYKDRSALEMMVTAVFRHGMSYDAVKGMSKEQIIERLQR